MLVQLYMCSTKSQNKDETLTLGCLQEVPTIIIVLLSLEILELWIGGWQCTRDGCTKTFECIFLKFCSSKQICMTKPLKATAHVYMYFSYEFHELFSNVKAPNE